VGVKSAATGSIAEVKLVLEVMLSNGNTKKHTYVLPPGTPFVQMGQLVQTLVTEVTQSLTSSQRCLRLVNPHVIYNPKHVVGVTYTSMGEEESEKTLAETTRKLGFIQ
jgi:hypothetical protein